ncbi:DNA-methyltransferase [Salinispira pacifica]|uniref:Methyltransferase n=1 Tax=Salinispira pacifica TaxID=1307761 RepID=V5WCZ6_9SPIO|nr:site-specific DNA-methyltransferase [Salinispira pacifica]AHC13662.1 Putative methyltransferase [Salinispira pacifica]
MKEALPRLDTSPELRSLLLPHCRLQPGEVWKDPRGRHVVAAGDARDPDFLKSLTQSPDFRSSPPVLALCDPPYNFKVGGRSSRQLFSGDREAYISFSESWVRSLLEVCAEDLNFYIWLGADQNDHFQPLPEFMLMMRQFEELRSRSFITMRNQRGYGTQKNWMSVRQELLYYTRGTPSFQPVYTQIPRILKGYYRNQRSNEQRSRNENIRPGNVWVDLQQVFYRLEENVPGAYAQKPLQAMERVILSSSNADDTVIDSFSHAGTTLLASERLERRCITLDIDPIFAEISIRRVEHYRREGKTGWQWESPFPEITLEDISQ